MKRHQTARCILAASLAITATAFAQTNGHAPAANMTVLKDDLASPGTVRASVLIGTELYDKAGKDVGRVKDIVLDDGYSKVDYAALSIGTAGIDEKMVAVPYRALSYGGPTDPHVYAQVPRDALAAAPGFNPSNWPAEVNAAYYRTLDKYYDTSLSAYVDQSNEPQAQKASANLSAPAELTWSRRATNLIGRDVVSPSGEKLGAIRDLVIDTKTGHVRYAVLVRGTGLDKRTYYAVPLNALRTLPNDKKLSLNTSLAELKAIPGFDSNRWPADADPRWAVKQETPAQ